jgi:hypothetical protein
MATRTPSAIDQEHPQVVSREELLLADQPGYDAARRSGTARSTAIRPALPAASGVARRGRGGALRARNHDLEIAIRGGGHNVGRHGGVRRRGRHRPLGDAGGVGRPRGRTARVQGGALWGDVDHETQAHGLATTGGIVSHTGVAGLTLGGGIGFLMRKHGLAVDNLLAAEVVTAEGSIVRAAADEHPDLFWALRGGGGNFGVVTSFRFALHPVGPTVLAGPVFWAADDTADVLAFYRDVVAQAPDELGTVRQARHRPPLAGIPEDLHWRPAIAVACCNAGAVDDGERAVRALRRFGTPLVDLISPTPYVAFQAGSTTPSPTMALLLEGDEPRRPLRRRHSRHRRSRLRRRLGPLVRGDLPPGWRCRPSPPRRHRLRRVATWPTTCPSTPYGSPTSPVSTPRPRPLGRGGSSKHSNPTAPASTSTSSIPTMTSSRVREAYGDQHLPAARRGQGQVRPRQRLPPQQEHPAPEGRAHWLRFAASRSSICGSQKPASTLDRGQEQADATTGSQSRRRPQRGQAKDETTTCAGHARGRAGDLRPVFGAPAVGGTATASTQYTVLIEQGASRAAAVAAVSRSGGTVIKQNAEVGTLTAAGTVRRLRAASVSLTRDLRRGPHAPDRPGAGRRARRRCRSAPPGRRGDEHNPSVSLAPQLDASLAPVGLDPLDANQWGLRMVKSDLARAVQPGDHGVMVGVLDSGVDATHPDIAPNINVALSRNFTTDLPTDPNGAPFDGPCEFAGCVDPPAYDDNGHGTHVAGIIARRPTASAFPAWRPA